ncbi:MAG: trypsin-like peptidase domain-containing protein [Nitrososphaerota archaeon]|nr:trypsin-like peptidase domain-containing protein [Nitrososphaerota archaeon]
MTARVICRDVGKVGSGFFFLENGLFLTNNHVVSRIDVDTEGTIQHNYSKDILVSDTSGIHKATLALDQDSDKPIVYDYAILKVHGIKKKGFEPDSPDAIEVGEEAVCISYPMDFPHAVVTKGIISAIISMPSHINSLHQIHTYLTNVIVNFGSSGSPLLRATNGKVIGIVTMPHNSQDQTKERLYQYLQSDEAEDSPVLADIIEFVLSYVSLGLNHAISLEYLLKEDAFT